jgi:hypothetical protein
MDCSWASIQSQRPVLVLAFQRGHRHDLGGMLRFGQERRPRLLFVQSLLMAGSTGVDHSDSRIVYRTGQVVCGPVNHI